MADRSHGHQPCRVCTANKRLEIDKAILRGESYSTISRIHNVPRPSVAYHAKFHLSHQLLKAKEIQEALGADEMLKDFRFLISKSKSILGEAEEKGHLNTSLNALKELRNSWESWIRIGIDIHAVQVQERESEKEQQKASLEKLSREELERERN